MLLLMQNMKKMAIYITRAKMVYIVFVFGYALFIFFFKL